MLDEQLEIKAAELAPHFKAELLQREHTVFQFQFVDGESFYLTVTGPAFSLKAGEHQAPTLRLTVRNHATCWGLLDGRIDGMQAFMDSDYRADGNIVLSQLLLYLFKSNDPAIAFKVVY